MTKASHTSSSNLRKVPKEIQKRLRATRKSLRNYEVVACVNVGRKITAAVAVIEDGHATYAVGDLYPGQFAPHFSKIDLALGTHLREHEMLRTETLLEQMEASGIEIYKENPPNYSVRYFMPELSLRHPTKVESVSDTLRNYLQSQGFTVAKSNEQLHVRHLERMRHRTGYIVKKEE